jgi:hypothetical protein
MFWPSYGTIRSKYIPEEIRASVRLRYPPRVRSIVRHSSFARQMMSIFRIPLNFFVILILLNTAGACDAHDADSERSITCSRADVGTVFLVCTSAHALSFVLYFLSDSSRKSEKPKKK